jgi:hypothetical protein
MRPQNLITEAWFLLVITLMVILFYYATMPYRGGMILTKSADVIRDQIDSICSALSPGEETSSFLVAHAITTKNREVTTKSVARLMSERPDLLLIGRKGKRGASVWRKIEQAVKA